MRGSSVMTYYQAYLIGRDGHYIKAVDLTCADDEAAKKRALKMVDGTMLSFGGTPAELQSLTASENNGCDSLIVMTPPPDASAESPGQDHWSSSEHRVAQNIKCLGYGKQSMAGKRVLVTGATGNVGGCVIRSLSQARGVELVAGVRKSGTSE